MDATKINSIAVSWMEGHYGDEDLQDDNISKLAFAAMKEICELSKDGGWTPCSDGNPKPKHKQWVLGMIDPSPQCKEDAEMVVVRYNKRLDEYTDDQGSAQWIFAWANLPKRPPYRGEA